MTEHNDGWVNLLTGLGVPERDKSESTSFAFRGAIGDTLLTAIYREDYLARLIVDKLPEEMFRAGYDLRHASADAAALRLAYARITNSRMEQPDDIAAAAYKAARLYGGAAVWLGCDDGPQDKPLDLGRVHNVKFYRVIDRRELFPCAELEADFESPNFGEPVWYEYMPATASGRWRIHNSRLVMFPGARIAQRDRAQQQYWDDSVLSSGYEVIRAYGAAWGSINNILNDAAQGVFKIKNLMQMVVAGQKELLQARMETLDMTRSAIRALVLDKDNEEYERQVFAFTGLPDIIARVNERVASMAECPITVLFGISPAGLNATGESDIRLFYDRCAAKQRSILAPRLLRMYAPVAAIMGVDPAGLEIDFAPLWGMTDTERAAYRKTVAETDAVYIANEVYTPEAIATARSQGGEWSDAQPKAPDETTSEPTF